MSVIYVHIGLPKTGTTHLQNRLWRNRERALSGSGLLLPGEAMSDHFHAAAHLQPERYLDWVDPAFAHAWPSLVSQMKAWSGTSLISHELFATATDQHIARLLGDLGFADEVHVVVTVRDLARQLPSVWQENVKNQRRASYEEFVDSVQDPAGDEPFWEFQDYVGILARWSQAVGADRVHVVTVPRGTPEPGDSLWERFLRVLDVDPAPLTTPVPPMNTSLSAAQAEFLRNLNFRLQPDDIDWRRYDLLIKEQLIKGVLFKAPGGAPQGLTAPHRVWAAEKAGGMVAAVREAGYHVTGDLGDLEVAAVAPEDADEAPAPTTADLLEVALDSMAAMVLTTTLPKGRPEWQRRAARAVRRVRREVGARRPRR